MGKKSSYAVLHETIQILEVERAIEARILNDQFRLTYEHFKPVNMLKRSVLEFTSAPHILNGFVDTALSLATGYLSKKIVVGTSGNIVRKLLGIVVQLGVTNRVAQHPDMIKLIGQFIFQHISGKREKM